jgi:subtilisin-like proprotein convertase family protein
VPLAGNRRNRRRAFGAFGVALGIMAASTTSAAVVLHGSGPLQQWIPDDTATGLASTISVGETGLVTAVSVRLDLSVPANQTGWLGDLYVYLRHDDGFAVLLNRPGRTDADPFGYGDSQAMNLTFADGAPNGDVHGYRGTAPMTFSGSFAGPLLGAWAPDGRAVDPLVVFDSTPRTALLSGFAGHDLGGDWTLFVADLSGGGQHRLDGWALEFDVGSAAVPEPATTAVVVTLGLLAFAGWRRRGQRWMRAA